MLSIESLTRRFGTTTAIDDVSFEVRPGRLTGFVGANGAGKTTTMRIVMGVLAATSGSVTWSGKPVTADDRRTFGYMPEERGLYAKMAVDDQLVFFARLHGLEPGEARAAAHEVLARLDLADRGHDQLDSLSLGNQQRVQIAAALIHRPALLVLDEPFSGLDPVAVDTLGGLLRAYAADGVPVLFSSHQLDLVEELCDDLVILSHGAVVASGSADRLRDAGPVRYRVTVDGPDAAWIRDLPGIEVDDVDAGTALLQTGDANPSDVLAAIVAKEPVREFMRVVPRLSEVFREVTR